MSFLDDLSSLAGGVRDWFDDNPIAGGLAKVALLGYTQNKIQKSINKQNSLPEAAETARPDLGVRIQLNPSTDNSIPVVYGQAWLGGVVTDAYLTNNNQTMYYVLTLCEKTGNLYSTGSASVIHFDAIYWNDQAVSFQDDGITVAGIVDQDGNSTTDPAGLIQIYCYNGGSSSPVVPTGYSNASLPTAFSVIPDWTSDHTMDDLVFAIIKMTYSRDKSVTGLGTFSFKLRNTMTQPGDCLLDYMTNARYGAGIPQDEIYLS